MYQPLYRPASEQSQRSDIFVTQRPKQLLFDLWIYCPQKQAVSVKVVSRKGDVYFGLQLDAFQGSLERMLDLTSLPEGIYMIQVIFKGKTFYKRLAVPAKSSLRAL
ncbi:MAG: hypothetical protein ACFB10_00515 [Salibacteraceae bacterium]|mgnify:CR=1 FL=1